MEEHGGVNLYAFVGNNSLSRIDRLGLETVEIFIMTYIEWATVTAPLDTAQIDVLREALIVAKLDLTTGAEISVSVQAAPGQKCMRSWFIREDVGTDSEHPTLSIPQANIVRELLRRGAVTLEQEA